ncbi:hypothetical protein L208DRAFT_358034 [Tricholoma matsutake]|nr:hypothetical protein L208DRAFT_358034 [Tricholoma matsutake 945]
MQCYMPLQRTFSCCNFNDENQPVTVTPPSTPDPPITHGLRRRMQSLRGSALFNSLSSSSPTTNQPSDPCNRSTTIPYQRSLQYHKDQRQIEKFKRNKGATTSLADSPSAVSQAVVLCSPEQPLGPCMPASLSSNSQLGQCPLSANLPSQPSSTPPQTCHMQDHVNFSTSLRTFSTLDFFNFGLFRSLNDVMSS